jgi:hypothetical protein
MKKILLFLFLSPIAAAFAQQTGTLRVEWEEYHEKYVKDPSVAVTIQLVKDNQVLEEFNGTHDLRFEKELPAGEYEIRVIRDNRKDFTVYRLDVEEGKTLYMDLNRPENYTENMNGDDDDDDTEGITFYLNYGSSKLEGSKNPIPMQLTLGSDIQFYKPYTKRLRIGLVFGFSATYAKVKRPASDTLLVILGNGRREQYNYLNYYVGLTHRIMWGSFEKDQLHYIDFGADYFLPLWFRHSSVSGNQRLQTRKLHEWTDVRAYARLGFFEFFSISYRYRIFDFAKGVYPELPKHEIGIGLTFQ